jgi:hypothetical protein
MAAFLSAGWTGDDLLFRYPTQGIALDSDQQQDQESLLLTHFSQNLKLA